MLKRSFCYIVFFYAMALQTLNNIDYSCARDFNCSLLLSQKQLALFLSKKNETIKLNKRLLNDTHMKPLVGAL